jgi:predicted transcriptional regulator YheO
MADALGSRCEVVLHDFRRPERSIIAIAGHVTGRHTGDSVSEIGLAIIAEGDDAKEKYDYTTRSNGRIFRSTTVPLRDSDEHVFGALCVNADVTEFWNISRALIEMIGEYDMPTSVAFVDDIDRVISEVLEDESLAVGQPLDRLSKAQRLQVLRVLERRGVFALKHSVPQVAAHLGLSRATLYNYLRSLRDAD